MRIALFATVTTLFAGLAASAAVAAEPPAASVSAAAIAASAADASGPAAGEPNVRRTVIQDQTARIDELRVRGQVTHITVDPKGRAPAYEIITVDGSRDLSDGPSASRGAAGKRVWNVFRF